MAKNDFKCGGWNSYTLQCGTIMALISPGDSTVQYGMWLWDHDSDFIKWQYRPTLQRDMWIWDDMSLNSPGGSTLQCGRWLWDDMPLNSPKRLPYWNFTSSFDFGHSTAVDRSFCTSLRNFIQIGPPLAEKNDVISIFKMADLRHLGFYGSNHRDTNKISRECHTYLALR